MSKNSSTIILGIETSCDETAAALVEIKGGSPRSPASSRDVPLGEAGKFKILANIVSSQIDIHKKYGGVVPEIAARKHVENIIPVIEQALTKAKITPQQIDKIAVTVGPGLVTSLLIGVETAKTLAYAWGKDIVPVNHLKAHLYANWLENKVIKFPAIALIVSGGHTELIYMKNKTSLKKIGQTVDDAAGEAFDKVAKLLGLDYPGGPEISKLAKQGNASRFKFPRPMINSKNYNFSFSGLKTAVLYQSQKIKKLDRKTKADICAGFQQAVVDTLITKTTKAAKQYKVKTIMLSGGVAANKLLRKNLEQKSKELKLAFFKPAQFLCTDNAAMIAVAANFEKPIDWQKIKVDSNLEI